VNKLIYISLIVLATNCALAQTGPGHEWNVTLKIADNAGQPVAGAETWVNYLTNRFVGFTDTNGIYVASHTDHSVQLAFQVQKSGYYTFGMQYQLGFNYDAAKWNPTVDITLGKIINPIPMYSRRSQIEIPVVDKPIGFDLIEYDWVNPYGKGKQSDIIFETHRRWASRNDFNSTTKITFSNPSDGLIVAPAQLKQSSRPRIADPAPLDGYSSILTREISNTPAGGWQDQTKDQNYYFRIRTVLDENGVVKTALYGKIYGDFTLDPINSKTTWVLFTYYINPTPNSLNVEFDPTQNLFGNLPAMQQVKDP